MGRLFKGLVCIFMLLVVCGVAQAESIDLGDIINKLPEVETGMAYSFIDKDYSACASAPILKGKDKFEDISLNLGVVFKESESQESNEGVLGTIGISYDVVALKEYFDIPILDLFGLKVEGYVGIPIMDTLNGDPDESPEVDVGTMFKVISIDL